MIHCEQLDIGLRLEAYRDTRDDSRSLDAHSGPLLGLDGSFSIDGITQGIHNPPKQLLSNRDIHDGSCPLYNVSLLDQLVVTKHHHTNVVWLQVQSHTLQASAELNHLLSLDVLQAIHTGDTITNAQHTAGLLQVSLGCCTQDALLQDAGHLCCSIAGSCMKATGGQGRKEAGHL